MTETFVKELFPELELIKNEDLRQKSVAALMRAMEKGGWDETNVDKAPVSVSWENVQCNLIEHIRCVTQVCIDNYNHLAKYYDINGSHLDWDLVVSGALLHDIGKFTEFAFKDGQAVHSDSFYLMRHPLSGAIIASEVGLPDEIVHLIATHSFEGDKSNMTAVSTFVRTIDLFVFNNSVYGLKKK